MTERTAGMLVLCVLTLPFFSCKKSSGSTNSTKSKTVLITQSTWKIQSAGLDLDKNGTVDQDITSSIQSCQLDNIYTFKSDSTGIIDEGATKCNATDPQTSAFSWSFENNQTEINGDFGLSTGAATILTLNDTNFVFYSDQPYGGGTYRVIVTMKH